MGMASFEQEELPSTASSRKKVWMFRPLTWIQHDLWPLQLTNLAVTLSLLAMGVLLGVVSTLHTMGYFGSSNFLLNPLNSIAPPSHTSGVYSPLPSPLFNVSTSSGVFNGSVTIPSGGASLQSNASIAVGSLNSSGLETEAPTSQFAGTSINVNITVPERKIPTVPDIKAPEAANNQTFSGVTYQNMSVTWHNMIEDELLWMASMAPTRPRGGALAHVSKIAYMYITRGPLPFEPIWNRYFQGHEKQYSIYIHASPSYVPNHAPTSPFYGRFIPSKVRNSLSSPFYFFRHNDSLFFLIQVRVSDCVLNTSLCGKNDITFLKVPVLRPLTNH